MAIASAYQDHNGLTLKQKLFCKNYLSNGYNATKAVIDSGYDCSYSGARAIGTENLAKPLIKKYIGAQVKEITDKLGFDIEYRLRKLKMGADMSIPDILETDSLEEKVSKMKVADIRAGVACIAEANKMDGSYASIQNETKLTVDSSPEMDELIEKSKQEY